MNFRAILASILAVFLISVSYADSKDFGFKPLPQKLRYKEDFFRLYNQWLYADQDSISRNIYFLELATVLPYDHPVKALAPITNEVQYERYKNLLMTHICVMLTQEYINYGYLYMKEHLYFYNKEFKKEYLDGFDIAEFYFKSARNYWGKAMDYAQQTDNIKGFKINLQYMEDEIFRMKTGDLNYNKVIDNLMGRLQRNRDEITRLWGNE